MIPVGDTVRSYRTPWVTWAFIALNLVVFVRMLSLDAAPAGTRAERLDDFREQTSGPCYGFAALPTEMDRFICVYGFQPREFFATVEGTAPAGAQRPLSVLLSIVTATFLHAGWLHILGNMLFLWVFGDNVEDRLGHAAYALFYLAGGVAANLVQGAIEPDAVVPVVGASGAVAAVLGAYLWYFPGAMVRVVIPVFVLIFIPLPIPAVVMIGLWFVQNLFAGFATINDATAADAGVAWFAHIGGFLFGLAVAVSGFGTRGRSEGRR